MANEAGIKLGVQGEKQFKQALADINRELKVSASEMTLLAAQYDKGDKSTEALTARQKALSSQLEKQKDAVDTIAAALKNAETEWGASDKRTQAWQEKLYKAKAEVINTEKALEEINKDLDTNAANLDDAADAAKNEGKEVEKAGEKSEKAGRGLETLGKAAKAAGAALAATGAAAVAAGKKLFDMTAEVAAQGDEIDKESQKLGLSAEAYQELAYAMDMSGSSISDLSKGMQNITNAIADTQNGVEGADKAFAAYGITLQNSDGTMKSTEQVLLDTLDALAAMPDETQRSAAAQDIFGKSAKELAPLLNSGAEGIKGLMQEAQDYGMVMSNEAVKASADFDDSLTRLKGAANGAKTALVSNLLPGITEVANGLAELVSGQDGASESIEQGASDIITALTGMVPEATELIATLAGVVLEAAPDVLRSLGEGLIGAAPELLPIALDVILQFAGFLMEMAPDLLQTGIDLLVTLAEGISSALPDLIPTAVGVILELVDTLTNEDNLSKLLDAALDLIMALASGLLSALPQLIAKLPQIIDNICQFFTDNIDDIIEAGLELLSALLDDAPGIIKAVVSALPQIVDSIVGALTDPETLKLIIQAGFDMLVAIGEAIPDIVIELGKSIPSIVTGITDALADGWENIKQAGKDLLEGLWKGISEKATWLWDKVKEWAGGLLDGIKGFFGIHSPSRVMEDEIAKMMVYGMGGGFEKYGDYAVDAMADLCRDITDAAQLDMPQLSSDFTGSLADDINELTSGYAGAGARVVNNYYVSDPSPEYYRSVMQGVDNLFGGVYA